MSKRRVALEVLIPPPLGGTLTLVGLNIGMPPDPAAHALPALPNLFLAALAFLFLCYLAGGLPAIFYCVCMEGAFRKGLDPRGGAAVGVSAAVGFACGALIGGFVSCVSGQAPPLRAAVVLGVAGTITGLLTGTLVRWRERQQPKLASESTAASGGGSS